ncbi:hypothetical protein WA026_005044 [Henosepilachna vigintioctopunctata]|uniref:Uncharacterized protein n=1 Tax=Henosepilachna vigintioctopunctata TaxID=420089 RepID=A0AAW1UM00_9CUCU
MVFMVGRVPYANSNCCHISLTQIDRELWDLPYQATRIFRTPSEIWHAERAGAHTEISQKHGHLASTLRTSGKSRWLCPDEARDPSPPVNPRATPRVAPQGTRVAVCCPSSSAPSVITSTFHGFTSASHFTGHFRGGPFLQLRYYAQKLRRYLPKKENGRLTIERHGVAIC